MRGRTIRSKRRIWFRVTVAAVLVAAQCLGCATPEQRHRVLTFFFDGVPPLYPDEVVLSPDELEQGADSRLAVKLPPPEITVHGPVAKDECEQCHSTSASNRLKATGEDLCWSCHKQEDILGKVIHGPVAAGFCTACHDPHKSRNPHLLVRAESELCVGCHDPSRFVRFAEHRAESGDDCLRCHDPHAASRQYMLKRDEEAS